MATLVRSRAKPVTAPLGEKVRARLRGDEYAGGGSYASSGSEHDGDASSSSPALSRLLHCFFFEGDEGDDGRGAEEDERGGGSDESDGEEDRHDRGLESRVAIPAAAMVRDLMNPSAPDRFRDDLATDVLEAVERLGYLRTSRSAFRRAVMAALRESGYNAGVCKTRWGSGGGITAGTYEYVDVIRAREGGGAGGNRYIVDVDFGAEFEIARASAEYAAAAAEVPLVFIGRAEELRTAVRVMADAARRSLRAAGMHVPPWRKARYMLNKWLGPYKRTTNATPAGASSSGGAGGALPLAATMVGREAAVKCRAVGFRPAVMIPAARMR